MLLGRVNRILEICVQKNTESIGKSPDYVLNEECSQQLCDVNGLGYERGRVMLTKDHAPKPPSTGASDDSCLCISAVLSSGGDVISIDVLLLRVKTVEVEGGRGNRVANSIEFWLAFGSSLTSVG